MTGAAQRLPPLMTVDEFLAWPGDGTDTRYELVDGELRAQDAASDPHGTIVTNLAYLITGHLRSVPTRCRVVTAGGVRPKLRSDWNYRIPDLVVTCAPPAPRSRDVPDPKVLIEVVSPSNHRDTWDNVRNYVTLPSVEDILLVSSSRPDAQLLRRDETGAWIANPINFGPGASVPLASIDCALAMADIYLNTDLEARARG